MRAHTGSAPGGAGEAGGLVVVVAHPHHHQVAAGEAGEPAVAVVRGGAGLAGDDEVRRQHGARGAPGAVLHHLHHHAIELVDILRRGHLRHLQREGLQRLAVGGDHRAHRAQRVAEAAVGDAVVQLRRLQRGDIDRAQQHRRHCRGRRRQAEARERLRHLRQA